MTALNKEKLLKQLSKRQKRRREQQSAVALVEAKPASAALQSRMVRFHQDLLQNIEHFVLHAYRNDTSGTIDDLAVMDGYRHAILGIKPDRPPVAAVVWAIAEARAMRERIDAVDDALWHDALRVLMRSVQYWSYMEHGEKDYLDHVGRFVR